MKFGELDLFQKKILSQRLINQDERDLWKHTFLDYILNDVQFEMSLQYIEANRMYIRSIADIAQYGTLIIDPESGGQKQNPAFSINSRSSEKMIKLLKYIELNAVKVNGDNEDDDNDGNIEV